MNPRKKTRKKLVFLALLIGLGLPLLGTLLLVVDGFRDEVGRADVGLVLGSKVETDGSPSPRLRARLDKTLEHYRAGRFPYIITSGGVGKEGHDEAMVMRDYLVSHGVPADRVLIDSEGINTFASAKNARQLADRHQFRSIFVVSQHFHISRSKLALRRFGFPEVYSSRADILETRDVYSSFREFFGYLSYLLRDFPKVSPIR